MAREEGARPAGPRGGADRPSFVGRAYTLPDYYEIGREQVRAFAKAVRNFDPIHHDEAAARAAGHSSLVTPPTFAAIIGVFMQEHLFGELAEDFDVSQAVQAEQRFSFLRPVCAGERLECSATILGVRRTAGANIIETENIGRSWGTDEVVLVGRTKVVGYARSVGDESLKDLVRNTMTYGHSIF